MRSFLIFFAILVLPIAARAEDAAVATRRYDSTARVAEAPNAVRRGEAERMRAPLHLEVDPSTLYGPCSGDKAARHAAFQRLAAAIPETDAAPARAPQPQRPRVIVRPLAHVDRSSNRAVRRPPATIVAISEKKLAGLALEGASSPVRDLLLCAIYVSK